MDETACGRRYRQADAYLAVLVSRTLAQGEALFRRD